MGLQHQPSLTDPLPLALYSLGADLFREVAEQSLAAAGRDWRVAYTSQSMVGLGPVVQAGLAIVVVTRSMLTPSCAPWTSRAACRRCRPWSWPCTVPRDAPPSRPGAWPS